MIDISDVTVYREQKKVLEHFSLRIRPGERVAILGPNGAGKSTFLKLISRELYPVVREGSHVRLFGDERVNLWELRSRIGFVSQDLQADYTPYTPALEVITSGFFGAVGSHGHLQPDDAQLDLARQLLARLGMADFAQSQFQRLSTGQQRRLLLARALVHNPEALIFDEPASGLDMGAAAAMLALLREFCRDERSIIIATHHVDEIIPEIERVVLIAKGQVVADGPKGEILTSKRLSELYGTPLKVREEDGWYRCWHAQP